MSIIFWHGISFDISALFYGPSTDLLLHPLTLCGSARFCGDSRLHGGKGFGHESLDGLDGLLAILVLAALGIRIYDQETVGIDAVIQRHADLLFLFMGEHGRSFDVPSCDGFRFPLIHVLSAWAGRSRVCDPKFFLWNAGDG